MKLFRIAAAFGALIAAAAAAAFIGTEFVMAPSGGERNRLISMYIAIAAAVFVVGLALVALTRRSLNQRILAVSIAGPLVVGLTTIWGASSMFTSSHDTQFVIILTALATALAALLVNLLSSPLLRDLRRISEAAKIVGEGDLSARTGIDRSDELGELGYTFDSMAEKIEQAATERKRLEGERQFMLSSLSHDARTPLTAMRAAVEALQDGMAPDPVRYLDSIEHDLRSIEAIVENLFVIGKLDADQLSLHIEALDLVEVAALSVIAIEPLAKKHDVSVVVEVDGPVQVKAARAETERMINNLLTNSIRHSPPGGTVRVIIEADPLPTLSVCDDGPGFPEEFVDKAFDQFERADVARTRAHGGAGLGLAVVRGLAEAQGGRVWAKPGPGGRVTFELPAGV
ncbi:MAG: HAMP domain-containing histidine kinase [Acidimicrobiaceae bacterium]|nr:HAMP domain-containing histidine kinase [Acidimicrobiaceae bacterium]MBT6444590.1 HAMP domain-containing histidine kinase [Acidimicrobiaceae bacterium]MCO4834917.1 HAMP domain-containing histidine kinase [Acidimicrobiaceae bacterium]MDB4103238.1 HAMP domain-containing histidine kinase [Acidimicrobiales bacterium]MDG1087788.1 HAMP domain-containing sensor histidine kinase [Acidimicrobiales bacterium]